jgi:hypothetical protein
MQEQILSMDFLKEKNKMVINYDDIIKHIIIISDDNTNAFKTKIFCELKNPIIALKSKCWIYNKNKYNYIVEKLFYKKSLIEFRNTHDKTLKKTHYCFKEETLYIYVKQKELYIDKDFIGFKFLHELPLNMQNPNKEQHRTKRTKIYVHKENFFYSHDIDLKQIDFKNYDYSNPERNKIVLFKLIQEKNQA